MNLNLGCGDEPELGDDWINCDLLDLAGVQVVHNMAETPYPFRGYEFEYIKAIDVLEHLPNYTPPKFEKDQFDGSHPKCVGMGGKPMVIEFVRECYRILKPGGTLHIQTVHWDSPNCWKDPTHVRGFDKVSMDYFDPNKRYGKSYGYYSEMVFDVTSQVTDWIDPDTGEKHIGNCVFDMVKL